MECAGLQVIKFANVGIDVSSHDDVVVCREFAEESVEGVKEAGIDVVGTVFGTRMVNRCKGECKVLASLLTTDLFS